MRKFIPLLLIFLFFAPTVAQAVPSDIDIAKQAWSGPCSAPSQPVQVIWDHNIAAEMSDGVHASARATGLDVLDDKLEIWTFRECSFTVDPVWYGEATPYERCYVWVHEMGHLAGHHHSEGGVMGPHGPESGVYEPCAIRLSFTEKVDAWLARYSAAKDGATWTCGAKRGVRTCRVEAYLGRDRWKHVRYRFRQDGAGKLAVRRLSSKILVIK